MKVTTPADVAAQPFTLISIEPIPMTTTTTMSISQTALTIASKCTNPMPVLHNKLLEVSAGGAQKPIGLPKAEKKMLPKAPWPRGVYHHGGIDMPSSSLSWPRPHRCVGLPP